MGMDLILGLVLTFQHDMDQVKNGWADHADIMGYDIPYMTKSTARIGVQNDHDLLQKDLSPVQVECRGCSARRDVESTIVREKRNL